MMLYGAKGGEMTIDVSPSVSDLVSFQQFAAM